MELDAGNLAVLVLDSFVGIAIANVFLNSFPRFLICIAVLALVVIGLVNGESRLIADITFTLARYFASEPFALPGVILGVLIGVALRKRRR